MVVVMKPGTRQQDIDALVSRLKELDLDVGITNGVGCTILGLVGDTTAVEDAIEKVRAGQGLLIFPEGTRSRGEQVGPFKTGAFRAASKAKVPIVYDTDDIVTCDEGQMLYKNDIVWCRRFNLRTIADLGNRIVDDSEYQSLWIDRCEQAYNLLTQTNDYERVDIQRQYPDLFLYGANTDLTICFFENLNGKIVEVPL